eukprot:3523850-Prymnesium_polylepis.1
MAGGRSRRSSRRRAATCIVPELDERKGRRKSTPMVMLHPDAAAANKERRGRLHDEVQGRAPAHVGARWGAGGRRASAAREQPVQRARFCGAACGPGW